MRDEYNPLLHPEEHRATAIKFSFLWMSLAPWIEAGIVYFIRPLHDFIPGLYHEVLRLEKERFDESPILKTMLEEQATARMKGIFTMDRAEGEMFMLMYPDKALRRILQGDA